MKILYDHQIFEEQKFGGISRYFCELIRALGNLENVKVDVSLGYSKNEYLKTSIFSYKAKDDLSTFENFMPGRNFKGKWNLYMVCNKIRKPIDAGLVNKSLSIEALKNQDFDIFHPTYYDDYFLAYMGNKPFVLTVYDMIHEIYPEFFGLADMVSARKRNLVKMAHKIFAISECTKKDLIHFFGVPSEKIVVTHLATSMNSDLATHASLPFHCILPERYILFVGARNIYKNFYFFINSMLALMEVDPTLHIFCTGGIFNANEKFFLEKNGIADRVHQHAASDTELEYLYQRALAFVFPSLYEGFGIPVLEAFSNACPMVLANAGSLPEIAGNAAVYFEPKNTQSVHAAMSEVLYNPARRTQLVEFGKKRLKQFSWRKTCEETETVYRDLMAGI
ncbi:MAG: glycosyltransferase family 4 protein [Ferruginibacter sp.]|nr:glycosyltransferase family 4 protein [Rhodoferax sp.]